MNTIVLQTDYTKDKTSSYLASMETLIEDLNKKDNQRIVVEGQFYSEKSRRPILSYLKDSSRRLLYDYKTELVFYTSENFYTLEQLKANHNFKTFCVPDFDEVDNSYDHVSDGSSFGGTYKSVVFSPGIGITYGF